MAQVIERLLAKSPVDRFADGGRRRVRACRPRSAPPAARSPGPSWSECPREPVPTPGPGRPAVHPRPGRRPRARRRRTAADPAAGTYPPDRPGRASPPAAAGPDEPVPSIRGAARHRRTGPPVPTGTAHPAGPPIARALRTSAAAPDPADGRSRRLPTRLGHPQPGGGIRLQPSRASVRPRRGRPGAASRSVLGGRGRRAVLALIAGRRWRPAAPTGRRAGRADPDRRRPPWPPTTTPAAPASPTTGARRRSRWPAG